MWRHNTEHKALFHDEPPISTSTDPYSVKNLRFDYVIFDEASQVKPEDALGALLRAKYAVIMGDTRQLPPTTFFDILIDVESDDYDLLFWQIWKAYSTFANVASHLRCFAGTTEAGMNPS